MDYSTKKKEYNAMYCENHREYYRNKANAYYEINKDKIRLKNALSRYNKGMRVAPYIIGESKQAGYI